MESSTKANGLGPTGMDMVFSTGQMRPNIKVNGKRIRPVEKESLLMPTVILMMANGEMTKPMDLGFIYMPSPKPNIKVIGKMI